MSPERSVSGHNRLQVKMRSVALGTLISLVMLVLIGQLFHLQVIRGWEFPELSAPTWYGSTFSFTPAY